MGRMYRSRKSKARQRKQRKRKNGTGLLVKLKWISPVPKRSRNENLEVVAKQTKVGATAGRRSQGAYGRPRPRNQGVVARPRNQEVEARPRNRGVVASMISSRNGRVKSQERKAKRNGLGVNVRRNRRVEAKVANIEVQA